jgi:hypothetical protein
MAATATFALNAAKWLRVVDSSLLFLGDNVAD